MLRFAVACAAVLSLLLSLCPRRRARRDPRRARRRRLSPWNVGVDGATATAGPGCERTYGTVNCAVGDAQRVRIVLGGGNDTTLLVGQRSVPVSVEGGDGDDRFTPMVPGVERVDGREGNDLVDVRDGVADGLDRCWSVSVDGAPPRPAPLTQASSGDPFEAYAMFRSKVRPSGLVATPTVVAGGLVVLVSALHGSVSARRPRSSANVREWPP